MLVRLLTRPSKLAMVTLIGACGSEDAKSIVPMRWLPTCAPYHYRTTPAEVNDNKKLRAVR